MTWGQFKETVEYALARDNPKMIDDRVIGYIDISPEVDDGDLVIQFRPGGALLVHSG